MGFTPPEPSSIEFVIGTEDNGRQLSISSFDTMRPLPDSFEDILILIMCLTARNNIFYCRKGHGILPVKAAPGNRVREMPCYGRHSSSVISIYNIFSQIILCFLYSFGWPTGKSAEIN